MDCHGLTSVPSRLTVRGLAKLRQVCEFIAQGVDAVGNERRQKVAGSVLVEPIQGGEPRVFLEIGLIKVDPADAVDLKIHTVARSSHDCG